ncbi:sporulation protein YqfD [Alkalibacillus aidingensis]|uniref:sporulation protein YqfD n=1 Tax=Alkalibacillus aidingensis TaxID=2747607 RepID=UPI00166125DF|nr:sporulation protein YqfD [Alkalibacillus aidingensis]
MSFKGVVDVVIKSGQVEAFLNELVDEGVSLHSVTRIDENTIEVKVNYAAIPLMKSKRKKYKCQLKFKNREGLPFLYSQRKKWLPIMLSVIIAFLFTFILSNIVWNVTVEGGSPEARYEVDEMLGDLGLKQGNWVQNMKDISTIEREIMNNIEEISYVGINRNGTSYHVLIEESEKMEENTQRAPSDLIASKSGTIESMFVINGQPLVQIDDFVQKGDKLVTGILDLKNEAFTYSEGEVMAEVWYELDVTVDLSQYMLSLVPDTKNRYSVSLFDRFEWLFSRTEGRRLLAKDEKPLYFLHWELPISINKHYFYEETEEVMETDIEQHMEMIIDDQIKRQLGQSVEVIYQKVLHEERDSDKVKLEMFVKVLEDIGEEQLLSEEDMNPEEDEEENTDQGD